MRRYGTGVFTLIALLIAGAVTVQAGLNDILKKMQQSVFPQAGLSHSEMISGLKQALEVGTTNAVERVSALDGYYKNPNIKIPLPEQVRQVEKILRTTGFGGQIDQFELSMNRAAEKAAPQAKRIFLDAIIGMRFDDAKRILNGRENEATLYFKDKTFEALQTTFKPIARNAMSEVGVTNYYQQLDASVRRIPFADRLSFDLDQYVTDKALDGLFYMVATEEKKIRENPAARVTDLLKKVFGERN